MRLLREELARGSSVNIGFIAGNLVLQLFAGLLLLAFLGTAGVGVFAIGMLVLDTTMALVHLPGVAFVREFSNEEREEALSTVAAVKLTLCIPACAVIVAISGPVADMFHVPRAMMLILALYPPLGALGSIATMVFEARRKMARRNLPGLTENAARLAAIVALAAGAATFNSRPEAAAAAWVAGAVPSAFVSIALAGMPRLSGVHLGRARAYFSFGWRTTLAQLLQKQMLWVGTAAVYLAYLAIGPPEIAQSEAGVFKTAFSLMFYMVLVGAAVPGMLYPLMSRAFSLRDEEERRREAHRLLSLGFYYELILAVPLAIALVIVAPWAFATFLPAEFAPAAPLAQVLAVSGIMFCVSLPPIVALPAANRPDLILRLFAVQLGVAVLANAALVPQVGAPWGGSMGAALADWVTAAVGLAYGLWLTKKIGVPLPSIAAVRLALASRERAPPSA